MYKNNVLMVEQEHSQLEFIEDFVSKHLEVGADISTTLNGARQKFNEKKYGVVSVDISDYATCRMGGGTNDDLINFLDHVKSKGAKVVLLSDHLKNDFDNELFETYKITKKNYDVALSKNLGYSVLLEKEIKKLLD